MQHAAQHLSTVPTTFVTLTVSHTLAHLVHLFPCCLQTVLIMDEVDGMSAGDRGGVADLIQTIAKAKIPIIAICNDKYHQKLKSLRNHCLELEYRRAAGI